MQTKAVDSPNAVAIIGMSGRFPGGPTLEEFWKNLAAGVESITFFSDEELLAAGVPSELIGNPDYVKAAPTLEDIDKFDARFFQFSPREASITDPQHRLFLECAWEALENAGYCGDSYDGAIGVFAGSGPSMSAYLASDTHANPSLFVPSGSREHIGNDKDYLCTRVSYKLNLRGPSINVQTACSTSLVAAHLACQSVLMGESDMALAGGVTVRVPQAKGHSIRDNGMASRDGHCRPFDADASGTVFGSGIGVVVLKRLADALADRDTIHAVIRGSAVNNDGTSKISFWASSAEGQVPAMVEAMAVAEVGPETITFVETHGTATALGDPVEIQALTRAFSADAKENGYCAIGSVKSNIGHLDSAAGIAGLIKAVLALKHKALPPSVNFQEPNPRIDFSRTPFFVNTEFRSWDTDCGPRRAAVNSLGIGGTNAFAVLEEAPPRESVNADADRPVHILPLTAKSSNALRELAGRYIDHLQNNPQQHLADVSFTAGTGRGQFPHRLAVTAETTAEAEDHLRRYLAGETAEGVFSGEVPRNTLPKIALLFLGDLPAQAEKYRILYLTQPTFRNTVDRCAKIVLAHTGSLLLPSLFPQESPAASEAPLAPRPLAALALNVALAELLRTWGAEPILTVGLHAEEVSAACVAGIIGLDDAVRLLRAAPEDRRQIQLGEEGRSSRVRLVSGSSGQLVTQEAGTAKYWQTLDWTHAETDRCQATLAENRVDVLMWIGAESNACAADMDRLKPATQLFLGGLSDDACPWRHLLGQLAQLYIRGIPVDWKAFDCDYPRCRVELPTYPFQRKRFWSEPASVALSGKYGSRDARLREPIHPVLGRRIHCATQPNQMLYELVFDTSNPLLPGDPNPEQPQPVPESVFRELAQTAAEMATNADGARLHDFVAHDPLTIEPNRARVVQVALVPDEEDAFRLEIFSRDGKESNVPQSWTRHVSARVVIE